MGQTKEFAKILRKISKPTLIVANKIDVPGADKKFLIVSVNDIMK